MFLDDLILFYAVFSVVWGHVQELKVSQVIQEFLPVLPSISSKVLPEVLSRLSSRVIARVIQDTIL